MTADPQDKTGISRRTVVKGAAWSVPVIAAAVATPLAAASTAGPAELASAFWSASQTSLASLRLLDSASLLTAQALVTLPTQLTLVNGPVPIAHTASIALTVARPAGINIPVGRARGFGVYSFNGTPTPAGSRTASYQSAPIVGQFGFPATSYTSSTVLNIPANSSLQIPVEFGLAGVSSGVSISLLAGFAVTVSVTIDGSTKTATSTISVPVGAGIL